MKDPKNNDKQVRRIYVEKKKGLDVEATSLYNDLKKNLGIESLEEVRILKRYDVQGMTEEEFNKAVESIFANLATDIVYEEKSPVESATCDGQNETNEKNANQEESLRFFLWEYLPGQYDQRADYAANIAQFITQNKRKPLVNIADLIILKGNLSDSDFAKIKDYCINPVESRETTLKKPETLEVEHRKPKKVETIEGFSSKTDDEIKEMLKDMGFAMTYDDLKFVRDYFRDTEKRDPTITELKVIDTYWSDHCRHTTFNTKIEKVEFEDKKENEIIKKAFDHYLAIRDELYTKAGKEKDICLMDLATIAAKDLKSKGYLEDLDESEEINACSIKVDVDVDGKNEEWLVMFKNETHNHPTEIEPFGGASTCLGGAIRDPLSGRSYVYQAMRITGCADPTTPVSETLQGKLPQRKITTTAADGYSSYGNQIGVAAGHVVEHYDEDFVAKRMELGAVMAAAPRENVVREKPKAGDLVILIGGRTGRDGLGGATGSSKEHTEESLESSGSEVQKGNAPLERNIQRFFRKNEVSTLIKKCNDFGAGGVCVAIGELADGLFINLDAVPTKYEGLDGTELAISESQERMAAVINRKDLDKFIALAKEENLEAVPVAEVNNTNRLVMTWKDQTIVDISRDFLNTNGVTQKAKVKIVAPDLASSYFDKANIYKSNDANNVKNVWLENLQRLNVCSQKGMVERFDSTIGTNNLLMPFGGATQLTPQEGMAAKIPVLKGETTTATLMTYGYNSKLAKWSPFHGALYAVVQSIAKVVALGGDYRKIRLTFQEYFEKLLDIPEKWGKPMSALLGAFIAQEEFKTPSIGGKDSMSGTFMDINVPPTLVSFAVNVTSADKITSSEFKKAGNKVYFLHNKRDENELPDFESLKAQYDKLHKLICDKKVVATKTVSEGGIAEAISKMSFGNNIGFEFAEEFSENSKNTSFLFSPELGSIIFETEEDISDDSFIYLGQTIAEPVVKYGEETITIEEMVEKWTGKLEDIFPTKASDDSDATLKIALTKVSFDEKCTDNKGPAILKVARPRVFIPAFPGTNGEYDCARAFEKAGAEVNTLVIKNLSPEDIEESIDRICNEINNSQIIMLPGGYSGKDEPHGTGRFIAAAFSNPKVKEAVINLLNNRDGLILGISSGFQALLQLGLLPFGEFREYDESSPTLTYNTIGRHVSTIVRTRVASCKSPWFSNISLGDIHVLPVSHTEGRFIATPEMLKQLEENGQIAAQYVDLEGNPTYDIRYNPNGSLNAIEAITSPDGRILGKMAHSERACADLYKNIPGNKEQKIFESGVNYFK